MYWALLKHADETGEDISGIKENMRVCTSGGAPMPVNVSMETNNVQLTNGSTFLTINNFNFLTANGGDQVTITPTAAAVPVVLSVGATLNARPGQLTGTYVGSNRIFANYQ